MDGETLKIDRNGQKELIKLIGLDTPKSKLHSKAERDAIQSRQDFLPMTSMGIEAMKYLKRLVKSGDTVTIEFDVETRDKEGMLLGYVFLPDGRMVNQEVLRAGYAYLATSAPNMKYQKKLVQARDEAWKHGRGVWKKKTTPRSRP
jgi:micrococcal nuclease